MRHPSLTAKTIVLERYEIEALIEWHRDQKYRSAEHEEYAEAQDHKRAIEFLSEELKKP